MIEQGFLNQKKQELETPIPTDELRKAYGLTTPEQAGPPESGVIGSSSLAKPDMNAPVMGAVKGVAATAENIVNIPSDLVSGLHQFDGWLKQKGYTSEQLLSSDFKIPRVSFVDREKLSDDEKFGFAIGQTMAQMAAFTKVASATGSIAKGAAAGAGVGAAVQDPNGPRLSDSLKDTPIVGHLAQFLASDPTDSEAMGRFKNAVESFTLDTALGGAFVTAMAGYRKAPEAIAALKSAGTEAKAVAPEVKAVAAAPAPEPLKIDVQFHPEYQSPLAGKTHDQILSEVRYAKETGLQGGISNANPLAKVNPNAAALGIVGESQPQVSVANRAIHFQSKTDAEVLTAGLEIVNNPEKLAGLYNRPAGAVYTSEEIAALHANYISNADRQIQVMYALEDADRTGAPKDILWAELNSLKDTVPYLKDVAEGASSSAGQLLRVKGQLPGNFKAVPSELTKKILELNGGEAVAMEQVKMFNEIHRKTGYEGVDSVLNEMKRGATWGEAISEVVTRSLISSPGTAITTGASNIANLGLKYVERIKAPAIARKAGDHVLAEHLAVAGAEANKEMLRSMVAEVSSGIHTLWDSLTSAAQELAKGNVVGSVKTLDKKLGQVDRFSINRAAAMESEALGVKNRLGAAAVDVTGSLARSLSSGMGAVDRYSDAVAHASAGTFEGYMLGMKRGLQGEELAAFVNDFKARPPKPPEIPTTAAGAANYAEDMKAFQEHAEAWQRIDSYKEAVKFNQTPTTGWGAKFYEAVQDKSATLFGVPVLRAVSPFVRNKVNMAQAAMDVTPLLRGFSERNKAILAQGGPEATMLQARFSTMNGIMATGAALGAAGVASGMGSINPDVRRSEKAQGTVPYSLGNYAQFQKYGTAGEIMGLGADLGHLAKYVGSGIMPGTWDQQVEDSLQYIVAAVADKVTVDDVIPELWAGASDLASGRPGVAAQTGKTLLRNTGGMLMSGIPGVQPLKYIKEQLDPFKKMVNELGQQIPEYSLDTLGYPIEHNKGIFRLPTEFDDALLEKNKVLKGLTELGMSGALVNPNPGKGEESMAIRPMMKSLRFNSFPGEIELTPQQYNDMVLLSLGKKSPGEKGTVEPLIEKALASSVNNEVKKMQIKNIIAQGRKSARMQILAKYPELMQQYRDLIKDRQGAVKGNGSDFMEEE